MKKIIKTLIKEVKKAQKKDEVPVGCVITKNGIVISKAHNTKKRTRCCINHAEINAIAKASKKMKDWRLNECEMYVTLEPCNMCMEAIRQSRIKRVYYLLNSNFTNEKMKKIEKSKIDGFDLEKQQYLQLIQSFFRFKR